MSQETPTLIGNWRSVGYNRQLVITEDRYQLFTVTADYYSLYDQGTIDEFHLGYDRLRLHDNDNLSLYYAGDLTCYRYRRADEPTNQRILFDGDCRDPQTNFEDFRQVFSENYAFFDLHNNDWHQICRHFRPQVTAQTSDPALLEVFQQMIAPLRDGHTNVTAGGKKVRSMSVNDGPRAALKQLFDLEEPVISKRSSIDRISCCLEDTILTPYASTRSPLMRAGNDILSWCELERGIGYLNILRLFGFADTSAHRTADDLPHKPHHCGPFLHADMAALNAALDQIMQDMTGMDALIVDARINGGGFDRAGLEIANRFTDRGRAAYYKKARLGQGHTERQAIHIQPYVGNSFDKPVYLLTSPFTVSAGEVFALCMSAIPHVRLLGQPTNGVLSDNLFHRLPNGWEISLSNEIYLSAEQHCYESIGVPPDICLPELSSNLLSDLQQGLVAAVEHAKQQRHLSERHGAGT